MWTNDNDAKAAKRRHDRKVGFIATGIILALGVPVALLAWGATLDNDDAPVGPAATQAAQACGITSGLSLDGRTLTVNSKTTPLDKITCALSASGFDESTWRKMTQTRAIDGMQSEKKLLSEATWTYSPDAGLTVTLTN